LWKFGWSGKVSSQTQTCNFLSFRHQNEIALPRKIIISRNQHSSSKFVKQMGQELRFGIITVQNLPWNEEVRRWQFIEALGFDSVWVADHFVDPYRPNSPWFEGWTLLAALATQTSRIRIGTLVTSIALRNPAMLARQALTVDHISNGRLELGLGTGVSWDPAYSMIGIENWRPRERVARFREAVEIVDRCLRNRVTTFKGQYYQLEDAVFMPRTMQQPRPPITIGATGLLMLRLAARYADAWNSVPGEWRTSPYKMLEDTRRRNQLLDDYCKEIGRDPQTLRRSLLVFGSDAETAFNSVDSFKKVVERYRNVGITEFIFYYPERDEQIPILKQVSKRIIPNLRSPQALD
jgi:alkanesulfonate monooxygenase SsuD/methylene tetrahydromethanopterin reductase-like flavin-dependent oxidoreductase (luciferase family)